MYNYDKNYISQRATKFGFIRDTLEKVYRLADILEYINSDPMLKGKLALKGGTAINLTIFNLPRLSVDIDPDYLGNDSKEEMFFVPALGGDRRSCLLCLPRHFFISY